MRAAELDVGLLEPLLREIVALVGLPLTLRLVERFGGTPLYIPAAGDTDRLQHLVDLIGPEAAAALAREMGSQQHLIPKALPALRELRNRKIEADLANGATCIEVARRERISYRRLLQIKAGARDDQADKATPDLFS